ncbi:MAG: carboxypeptidase regulatory-like domain-containing protein [Gemmatimonadaceae bacterium]|nr:carboxypeptidase regulatory-like domain-containing protein [Gemmatimonadaceae bacterium]
MASHHLRAFIIALLFAAGGPLAAQSAPETIRGRVLDDSAHALAGATVTITRGPDRLVQTATTDADGRYSGRFDPGTGDYLVHVAATGFRSARRRVQALANERELVADFTLGRDLTLLATVKVKADKPVRASNAASPYNPETGASERWDDGVNGRVTPGSAGDLNAIAGTMPGVTMTPGGPSMLGAASSSNLVTLNGMALPGGSLPRAARVDTRVTGATFDPTRGGFSGANIDSRLSGGSRDFQRRNGYATFDAPQLQMTDAIGRSLGLVNGGFRASLGADGEAIRQILTYNVALDVGRTASDPASLLASDVDAWKRAGIAPDSVARVKQVANALGLPIAGSGAPTARRRDAITWLGRLDDVRDTMRTLSLTTYATRTQEGALGFGPLVAPVSSGEQTEQTAGAQLVHGQYFGVGNHILTQNRLGVSGVHQVTAPYLDAPGATVLVRSASDAATSDVAALQLGGNPFLATDDRRWTLEGSNETMWNVRGSKHRFKTQAWFRGDGLSQVGRPNALGQYTFNSLADLEANRPSSYSRTLTEPDRHATSWNGALAMAHQWNKSKFFSMLYGARLEANAFGDAPPVNAALNTALGVRSGLAPSRVHVSPRVGFSYTYSRAKDNGNGTNMNSLGVFYRNTMGYVRGGIGEFRDLYRPSTLADAIVGAGLAGSTLTLNCVGAAVPTPNWQSLLAPGAVLPTACTDGGAALAERAPSVTLVDPSFDVPRSWRASLSWGSNFGKVVTKLDALASYDLSQPSTLDANFAGISRFQLASESQRPMYVTTAAIDAGTGAVSARESRRSNDFGRVAMRTSDLRGYGGQVTATVMPDVFRVRSRLEFFTSASYTLQSLKQQYRGFDGAGFGDPRATEWAVGLNDARHAVVLQGGVSVKHVGSFTLYSRLQSGLPFTPIVQGDINGDGRANDRAFMPNPATATDVGTASQMRALLGASPSNVRECLERQLGAVAGRNSCRGTWTQQLNLQYKPRLPIKVRGRRLESNVIFENPLAGLDQALHGSNNLRGWGTRALPDPVLLVPRAFDASAQRFRYDVNPRFGDTRAFRTLSRQPFRVTVDFSLDFSVPYDMQQLRRALEPVKTKGRWERRSADSITDIYLRNTSNVHRLLLSESDSLFLNAAQIAALITADSLYSDKVRAIYVPLGRFLATQPEGAVGKAALDSVTAATKRFWPIFWDQADVADKIVTPQQKELLPFIKNMTSVTKEDRKDSQWYFGHPVPLVHNKPKVGS